MPEAPEGTQARSSGYNFVIVCCHRLLEKKEEISSNCHGIDPSRTHTNRLMPRRAQTRLLFPTFKRGKEEEEEADDLFAYYTIEGFGLRIESE